MKTSKRFVPYKRRYCKTGEDLRGNVNTMEVEVKASTDCEKINTFYKKPNPEITVVKYYKNEAIGFENKQTNEGTSRCGGDKLLGNNLF